MKHRSNDRKSCRPALERLMSIHEQIQSGRFPNSETLAQSLEVVTRTIKRDVEFMKNRMNLPIEYHPTKHGYYYTRTVDRFPTISMTESEMFAMLIAQKAIAQYRGTHFERPLRMAFKKLSGLLDGKARFSLENMGDAMSFRPFAPEDTDVKAFEVLTKALQARRAVKFLYKNLGAKQMRQRHAHPYHLACIDSVWYLFAWDVDRKAMRTFVLTRLSKPELTREQFKPIKDFHPDEYLKGSLSVFKGKDDFEVVLDFDEWATDLIRGRQWHSSQEFTELPGGRSSLRFRLNNIEEMERWALSWGAHATVVRPKALAERIAKAAETLAQRYRTAVNEG